MCEKTVWINFAPSPRRELVKTRTNVLPVNFEEDARLGLVYAEVSQVATMRKIRVVVSSAELGVADHLHTDKQSRHQTKNKSGIVTVAIFEIVSCW